MLVVGIGMVAQDLKIDNIVYGFSYIYKYRNSIYCYYIPFQMYSNVNILFNIFMPIYCAKRWNSALCHEKGFKSTAIMPKIQ